jgi:hypothetical protein
MRLPGSDSVNSVSIAPRSSWARRAALTPEARLLVAAVRLPAKDDNQPMSDIDVSCVTAANGWLCQVKVAEGGSETRHSVTLTRADFQRLTTRGGTPQALVKRSFEFMLAHEKKESILKSFALPEIGRYFPEYEREIKLPG